MICKNCGAIISSEEVFCKNCGATIIKKEINPEPIKKYGVKTPENNAALIDSIILSKIFKSNFSLVIAICDSIALLSLCLATGSFAILGFFDDILSILFVFLLVPCFICGIVSVVGAWEIFATKIKKKRLSIGMFSRYRSLIVTEKIYSIIGCVFTIIFSLISIGYKFYQDKAEYFINIIQKHSPEGINKLISAITINLFSFVAEVSPIILTIIAIFLIIISVLNAISFKKWNKSLKTLGLCTKKIPPYKKISAPIMFVLAVINILAGCLTAHYYFFFGLYRIAIGWIMFTNSLMLSKFELAKQEEKI